MEIRTPTKKYGPCLPISSDTDTSEDNDWESDGEWIEIPVLLEVTLIGATAQSLGGMTILIVPSNIDLANVDPATFNFAGVLGYGDFYSTSAPSASSLDGYRFDYYGTEQELIGNKVYKYDFDNVTGRLKFTLVTGVTVVKK